MARNTSPLVYGASVRPNWLAGDLFWYRNSIPGGHEYVLVDPARRTRARLFDHERLATALSAAAEPHQKFAACDNRPGVKFVAPRSSAQQRTVLAGSLRS